MPQRAVTEENSSYKNKKLFPSQNKIFILKTYIAPKIIKLSKKSRKYEQISHFRESRIFQSCELFLMAKCQKRIDQWFNIKFLQNEQENSYLAQNTNNKKCSQYNRNVAIGLD